MCRAIHGRGRPGRGLKPASAWGREIEDSPELIIISVHSDHPQTNAGQARRVPLAEPDDRREVGVAGGNERTKGVQCPPTSTEARPVDGGGRDGRALRAPGTASFCQVKEDFAEGWKLEQRRKGLAGAGSFVFVAERARSSMIVESRRSPKCLSENILNPVSCL